MIDIIDKLLLQYKDDEVILKLLRGLIAVNTYDIALELLNRMTNINEATGGMLDLWGTLLRIPRPFVLDGSNFFKLDVDKLDTKPMVDLTNTDGSSMNDNDYRRLLIMNFLTNYNYLTESVMFKLVQFANPEARLWDNLNMSFTVSSYLPIQEIPRPAGVKFHQIITNKTPFILDVTAMDNGFILAD